MRKLIERLDRAAGGRASGVLAEEVRIGRFRITNLSDSGEGYVAAIEPEAEQDRGWIIWLAEDGTAQIWMRRGAGGAHVNQEPDVVLDQKPEMGAPGASR
jgi:hypothetical protein